jgi:hypothetical protein
MTKNKHQVDLYFKSKDKSNINVIGVNMCLKIRSWVYKFKMIVMNLKKCNTYMGCVCVCVSVSVCVCLTTEV